MKTSCELYHSISRYWNDRRRALRCCHAGGTNAQGNAAQDGWKLQTRPTRGCAKCVVKNHNSEDCRKGHQRGIDGRKISVHMRDKLGHRAARCHDKQDDGSVGSDGPKSGCAGRNRISRAKLASAMCNGCWTPESANANLYDVSGLTKYNDTLGKFIDLKVHAGCKRLRDTGYEPETTSRSCDDRY